MILRALASSAFCVVVYSIPASAETWSCAINDPSGPAQIKQFRIETAEMMELTSDKLMREWVPDSKEFMGLKYKILLNNKYAIIAESDFADADKNKLIEINFENITIDKYSGNVIDTSMLSHLPLPYESKTLHGTCTRD